MAAERSSNGLAIRAENLTRRFGNFTAVGGVDLRVAEGEVFGFLGPNGSGKTTIIKLLTGLLPPSGGDAWVSGYNVRTQGEELREHIGYMSQKFSLYDDLTVGENLEFYGRIYDLPTGQLRRRIDELLAIHTLGPYFDRPAGKLSGGWKQRLALACAMLHKPKMMFLDEPTAGIDPVARRQLWDLIFELSGEGVTFFVTTHYMDEAERCSHVAYIYFSKLIADGTPSALKALPEVNPAGTRRIEVRAPEITRALQLMRSAKAVRSATVFGESIHALVVEPFDEEGLISELAQSNIRVDEIRPLTPNLEDVFVELTTQRQAQIEASRA